MNRMEAQYHCEMIDQILGPHFSPADLARISAANLGQDKLRGQLQPVYHFDDSLFAEGEQYIAEQRRQAVVAVVEKGDRGAALDALGRLLHARQDFYAHANWVRLWAAERSDLTDVPPEETPICPDATAVPGLISGTGSIPLYILYRIPLLGRLARRLYFPPHTHDAMNLDHPGRGPLFAYALAAATKHTQVELELLLAELREAGGETAVAHFLAPKNS
jgi:hypothetical protein